MRIHVAILLGVALLAVPAQAARSSDARTQTIRLVSTADGTPRLLVDRAPKGTPSPGDAFVERSILRNAVAQFGRPKGAVVGSDAATYRIVSASRATVKGTAKLPGGMIRIAAVLTPQRIPIFRVVGGTGDFVNARGEMELRRAGSAGAALNVYRLRLP